MTKDRVTDAQWAEMSPPAPNVSPERGHRSRSVLDWITGSMTLVPALIGLVLLVEFVTPPDLSPVGYLFEKWGFADARYEGARREDEIITQVAEAKAETIKATAQAFAEVDKRQAEMALQTAVVKQAPELMFGFVDQLFCGMQSSYGSAGYGGETDFCSGVFGGKQRSAEELVREQARALEAAAPRNAEGYIARAPSAKAILAERDE